MCVRFCIAALATFLLAGCSTSNQPFPLPLLAPQVTLAINPSSVQPGQQATLTWSTTDAASCVASGSWSGPQQINGSINVILKGTDGLSFKLACTGGGGNASRVANLSVAEPASGCAAKPAVAHKADRRISRRRRG